MHSKSTFHEADFKPASGHKTLIKSTYEYVEEKAEKEKKRRIDDNGRVHT